MKAIRELIEREAERLFPDVVRLRREFHEHPELSFQETRTSGRIAEMLEALGLEVRKNVATTGVVGLLRGSGRGATIALRADMDALPIEEATGLPYASKNTGVMHACNHDGHMAMLLGAAMILSECRDYLNGAVKFIFQPGEEGYAGALRMIEEGVLEEEPKVDSAFALHLDSLSDSGTLFVREGPMMASADIFTLSVIGRGGHGAIPHRSVDPIFVAGHVITGLQGIASRQVDPTDAVVVSICAIHAGTAINIIPDRVEMSGTVRLYEPELREKMPQMMEAIIKGITSGFGAEHSFDYVYGYPPTINDSEFTAMVASLAKTVLGQENVRRLARPRMPAEDFSYFLEKVPGAFAILGARPADRAPAPAHSPKCVIDESALKAGMKLHAAVALGYLGANL